MWYSVSIHAPTRGATGQCIECRKKKARVSIHAPTRGATKALDMITRHRIVSIHAPTRGATLYIPTTIMLYLVSIHAPTRGATKYRSDIFASNRFQSTHLQEVRLGVILTNSHKIGFNPRTYKRCDTYFTIKVQGFFKFQSTHLQEVRHYIDSWFDSVCYVSIHAPTRGATWFNTWMLFFCGVSIHAPTRGATICLLHQVCTEVSFNPRTYKRCDIQI